METGICRRCGCTWNTACIDEIHGACWWIDEGETLCSHCFYGFPTDRHNYFDVV
ncbi:paraquat-inducible protein A [Streptococcus cuniculi]|uniref:Paraquat-inducible protein A n=1 Tax=Streptococcus cuniculi TaxID=1432788 RepID=A0A4Y9J9I8_9STRE|nr:paraquat-inducible protein A [Streptococcus cuniculi]TFU96609.1 paraquat-inducible protein A [Streptococcus cuniculi]